MSNIIRWYNQNKYRFWLTILIIFGAIFFVQVANNFYKQKEQKVTPNTSSNTNNTIDSEISGKLESTNSIINNSGISSQSLKSQLSVIDDFIKYCNDKKVEQAYNLLTDECKEELFPNLNKFISKYYNKVFMTTKTYNIENWMSDTYKLKLTEDALTTGKIDNNSAHYQEYITLVRNNSEYKLNINNYIGRTNINKTTTSNGITVNVLKKETYMDYSEYTIKIQNNTDNKVILDNGNAKNTIYLLDENEIAEYANTGEITYSNFELIQGEVRTYTFKFSNNYSNIRKMKYLVFKNVILDYDEYNQIIDKTKYDKFTTITISL